MATSVRVRPVRSAADRRRFIDLPYRLYRGHDFWVAPLRMDQQKALDPKKNPFFEHGRAELFLAENESAEVVGRIAAIVNGMHLQKYDDATGFFGFFECTEDYAVAEALLDAVASWMRSVGLNSLRGPVNPSMNDTSGLLVDGFDRPPSILMPYNPPYYVNYLERYGFHRAMTMWAFYAHTAYVNRDKLRRGADIVMQRNPGVTLRSLDMSRFMEEAKIAMRIYNAAWSNNWGHVPMTEREFEHLAKDLKQVIEPELVFILELDGEPVAFSVSIPNLNRALKHIPNGRLLPVGLPKLLAYSKLGGVYELRMPLMGVLPQYHGRSFDTPLVAATLEKGIEKGYDACEASWVLDSNTRLMNTLNHFGAARDKQYAMLEMRLDGEA
jgi:GNAT superfamily N-acetyltransferase